MKPLAILFGAFACIAVIRLVLDIMLERHRVPAHLDRESAAGFYEAGWTW